MRTILLAGAAVLALGVGGAYAGNANHNGQNGNSGSGFAGNHSGNSSASSSTTTTTTVPISIPGEIQTGNGAQAQNGSQAASGHGTNLSVPISGGVANNNSAGRNATASGNSAANTGSGSATSLTTGNIAALTDCGCELAYGNLSDSHAVTTSVAILATSVNSGTVNGGKITFQDEVEGGLSNSMSHSVNGQGILTAQQNTGMNALQQNSVALGSVVGGNGGGMNGFH